MGLLLSKFPFSFIVVVLHTYPPVTGQRQTQILTIATPPPIGLKSMQNTTFLTLLRPIFALKTKIAPHWHWRWELIRDLMWFPPEKLGFSLLEELFSFGDHLKLEKKKWLNLSEDRSKSRSRSIDVVSSLQNNLPPIANSWLRAWPCAARQVGSLDLRITF